MIFTVDQDDHDEDDLAPCGHVAFDMEHMGGCPVCGSTVKNPIEDERGEDDVRD